MNKLIVILFFLSSCKVTKTYNIGLDYSPAPKTPQIIDIEKKINDLFVILKQDKDSKLNTYIWNGKFLTLKTKKKNSTTLDKLLPLTICPLNLPKSCSLVQTIIGRKVFVHVQNSQ